MLNHKTVIITKDRLIYVQEDVTNIIYQFSTNDIIRCTEIAYDKTYKYEKRVIYLNKSFINEIREK